MYESTQSKFPEGSIRAAVELRGDFWRECATFADDAVMPVCEMLKAASAKPAERARMMERREQIKRGEVLS